MRRSHIVFSPAATAAIVSLFLTSCSGSAETLNFTCQEKDGASPSEITVRYEGDESGTLNLKGAFGEMSMGAMMRRNTTDAGDGEPMDVTAIRGSGEATISMPDKQALEACISSKTPAEQLTDKDIVFMSIDSCRRTALPMKDTPINAVVEVTQIDDEAMLFISRKYAEKTSLAGGELEITTLPPLDCKVTQ